VRGIHAESLLDTLRQVAGRIAAADLPVRIVQSLKTGAKPFI
jgi:hypothetical protein